MRQTRGGGGGGEGERGKFGGSSKEGGAKGRGKRAEFCHANWLYYEGRCFSIVVWRTGCKAESYRDENALASANAALFAHLGERIGQLGSGKLGDLVRREGGVCTSGFTECVECVE